MSREVPEPKRGVALAEPEYARLYGDLEKLPRGLLLELVRVLEMGCDDHGYRSGRATLDVSFGHADTTIERVEGATLERALAKAVALGIDRRLALIVRARVELDRVGERITYEPLMYRLERLIMQAVVPKDARSEVSERAGESK